MDKCCRNCYRYREGRCTHPFMLDRIQPSMNLLPVERLSEEGLITEAIKEGFTETIFENLSENILAVTSKKKYKKIMEEFWEELDKKKTDWGIFIDEAITLLIRKEEALQEKEIEIRCPDEMCCKYFE